MPSIFKNVPTKQQELSAIEAFHIWSVLRARYSSIEANHLLKNFVHDKDFSLLISANVKTYKAEAEIMEKFAKEYQLKAAHRPPEQINFTADIKHISDPMIFRIIMLESQGELHALMRATVSSVHNDGIRKAFSSFLFEHLGIYEGLFKYGKVKAWLDVEMAYKTSRPGEKEMLSVSEAHQLWEHLSLRYDQLHLTAFFLSFIHDADFRALLVRGKKILEGQIQDLTDQAVRFEVPLPERTPATLSTPVDPETLEDKFVFRIILKGIHDSIPLHIEAAIDTIRNDALRKVFLSLLRTELDAMDGAVKYGKLKGWMTAPLTYKA